jgi:Tol biopolymer transport system component
MIPALGGTEQRLGTIATGLSRGSLWTPGLDWSPDGRYLAVVDRESPAELPGIFLLTIETGEKIRLTTPPPDITYGDKQPTFSPDGKTIAFIRTNGPYASHIYTQSLSGGEPILLTPAARGIMDLDWVADGSAIVSASASGTGRIGLFQIPAVGGTPVPLPFGEMSRSVSIAQHADRLTCTFSIYFRNDIWRVHGPDTTERGPPTRLIASSYDEWCQQYSPDGTKIAFVSARSGPQNIWVCTSEGTDCVQVTDMERAIGASWSPDGQKIAFRCEYGGNWEICVTDVNARFTRRLTEHHASDDTPSWSHDGKWIYFASNRSGEFQVWIVPSEGGLPLQISREGGFNPFESGDSSYVIYALRRDNNPFVCRVSANGGEEVPVLKGRISSGYRFTLWRNNVVYTRWDGEKRRRYVDFFNLESEQTTTIPTFLDTGGPTGLTVSPDGQWILVSKSEPSTSDIMLVEDFH